MYKRQVFCGDLDGDGDIDLAVTGWYTVSVLLNLGDRMFSDAVSYSVGKSPFSVYGGDFNGDGDMDLAVCSASYHRVDILLNNGNGSFAEAVGYKVEHDEPHSVYPCDLDGDQDIDLAIAAYWGDGGSVRVLLNRGDGSFSEPIIYPAGIEPVSIYAGDLDGDGDADLAVTNRKSNDVSVLYGTWAPDIAVPDSLIFSKVEVGDIKVLRLRISNSSNVSKLEIENILSNTPAFRTIGLEAFPISLNPGESREIKVQFSPDSLGAYRGMLKVLSNDPNEGERFIVLYGEGQDTTPPEVYPVSLRTEVIKDQIAPVTIRVKDNTKVRVALHYRSGGSQAYKSLQMTLEDTVYIAWVPPEEIGLRAVSYTHLTLPTKA